MKKIAILLCLFVSSMVFAGHPGESPGMVHAPQPVPDNVERPLIEARLLEDSMDGYNVLLMVENFSIIPPLSGAQEVVMNDQGERVLQGHLHLYINGKKVRRVYSPAIHIPQNLLSEGVNSITVSLNSHAHSAYQWKSKEIQSTLVIDTRKPQVLLNTFQWP